MAVFIYEDDAFEKLVLVEGEEYRRFRSRDAFGDCSFEAFLEKWNEICGENNELFGVDVNGTGAIYGLGSWNRYAVLGTGEIKLISGLSTGEFIDSARQVGFGVF